jgi:hypothetical protein
MCHIYQPPTLISTALTQLWHHLEAVPYHNHGNWCVTNQVYYVRQIVHVYFGWKWLMTRKINIIWKLLHDAFIMMEFLQITLKLKVNQLTCASWTTFSRRCLADARQLWARNCVAFYKVLMTITHGARIMFRCPLSAILVELHFMVTLGCFWHSAVKENRSATRNIIIWVFR